MKKAALVSLGFIAGLQLIHGPAAAHAVLNESAPAKGARVKTVPGEILLTFTEPPTTDVNVTVLDGCRNDVGGAVEVLNADATTSVADGQPGKWRVSYDVVSAVDGHPTSGSFSFRVAGTPDCDEPPATIAGGGRTSGGDGGGEGGSLIPLLIGSGALVVLAVAGSAWLRRGSA